MPSGVGQPRVSQRPPTIIETAATEKEARRVLEWQHDVARSISERDSDVASQSSASTYRPKEAAPPSHYQPSHAPSQTHVSRAPPRRYDSNPLPTHAPPPMRLIRRSTETTHDYRPVEEGGMSGKAIIGTILGAAAGAAVAYAMVRSEEPKSMHSPTQRRSSISNSRDLAYGYDYDTYGVHAPSVRVVERVEMEPAGTYVSQRDRQQDNTPRYVPAYSVRDSRPPLSGRGDMHRLTDGRDSTRLINNDPSVVSRSSRSRSQSFSEANQRPLTLMPAPAHSHVSGAPSHISRSTSRREGSRISPLPAAVETQISAAPKSHVSQAKSHMSGARSHVSGAKSHHSASTVKPVTQVEYGSGPVPASIAPSSASKAKSKASRTTTVKILPNETSGSKVGGSSKVASRVSAKDVELPRSIVSGVGYEKSVAPSDSVSCAGSRRSHRY